MALTLVIHFHLHEGKRPEFEAFEAQALEIFAEYGCKILAAFQPENHGDEGVPDEIHVLQIDSANVLEAYQADPRRREIEPLREESVRRSIVFRSGTEMFYENRFQTMVSGKGFDIQKALEQQENLEPPPAAAKTFILKPASGGEPQVLQEEELKTAASTVFERSTHQLLAQKVLDWQNAGDRRVIFAHTYFLMTTNMIRAIRDGEFIDKNWVRRLVDHFAGFYFKALKKYEDAWFSAPPVWRIAFEVAQNPNTFTAQHLLLGVNAHINFDLVVSLRDLLEDEWPALSPAEKQARYQDHTHVNQVIARTMDEAQADIINRYSPLLDALNKVSLNLDEVIISQLITNWREVVWRHAVQLIELKNPDEQHRYLQSVEYAALRKADFILLKRGPFKMKALE